MDKIKNLHAYYYTVARNMDKNDYRSNDNFYKYIDSVGNETDLRKKTFSSKSGELLDAYSIEAALCESNIENWLLLMENENLHRALINLLPADIEFLFTLSQKGVQQSDLSQYYGTTQQAVSKRWKKLLAHILKFF